MSTRTAIREKDDEVLAGAVTTRPPTTNRLFGIQVDAVTRDEAITYAQNKTSFKQGA